MKIAVLSDTHIPTRLGALPGRVYEVCAECDLILHAGDCVERDVLIDLERFAPVKAVHGNMDPSDLASSYPEALELELEGFRVCMTHGWGAGYKLENRVQKRFSPRNPDLVIFGHSHTFHNSVKSGVLSLNPGAVCSKKGKRSIALLTLEEGNQPEVEQIKF
ncbi:MAG: YfcE family phosphodiesterase [Candidatus Aegiribacteria sp.]|nr:YfcE family phosphodiesterase [Candidatus Aegiribacteria sp.]MBD3295226.1 YfcE family phosphodiesterase [Candidatus Fermentibacteria bacterium]